MSAFTAYAAHAELCAAIHAREEVAMLVEMQQDRPDLLAYPVSGDMLAIVKRGSQTTRKRRRRLAATVRRTA